MSNFEGGALPPKAANSNSSIVPFDFEGDGVRVLDRSGVPWFVLVDVCAVLGIVNPSQAASRLDVDEKGSIRNPEVTPAGGNPNLTIINESGLYSLILTSRKRNAKRFKKWVTAEVLPSIRKTGGYGVAPAVPDLSDPLVLQGLLVEHLNKRIEAERRAEAAEKAVEVAAPKVSAFDRIANADGSMCIRDTAKALQMGQKELFAYLRSNGWIYSRSGKAGDIAYQDKIKAGWLEHKVTTITRPDGSEKVTEQVRVTAKGLTKLARLFGPPDAQLALPAPTPPPANSNHGAKVKAS